MSGGGSGQVDITLLYSNFTVELAGLQNVIYNVIIFIFITENNEKK